MQRDRSPHLPLRKRQPGWHISLTLVVACLCGMLVTDAQALLRIDFEQKYFVHPGRQVWDFCVIRPDSIYHIYYHGIPEETPHATQADTIWHATSPDLKHWASPSPVLTTSSESWESTAIWAPDVVRDEENDRWIMAYTACDAQVNQRLALAESQDLDTWFKLPQNPVLEPDPSQYKWDAAQWWSNFRDPFLFRQDEQWHVLITALQWLGRDTGILYHAVSDDLINWVDEGYFFANDGPDPWRVPESPQYLVRGGFHHLLFGEYDTAGISHVSSQTPGDWTMAGRDFIDYGYAPDVKEFDPGCDIFGRLSPFQNPQSENLSYVVRFDTLLTTGDGSDFVVYKPHPLEEDWADWTGTSNLASPTFGDNPAFRGETAAGTVGNGYYGSGEYYQGPLSGRGSPGTQLGDGATGTLTGYPFVVTGDRIDLLVGGGNFPSSCYVALLRASDDAVLFTETGTGTNTMTPRSWNIRPYRGEVAYLRIVDSETAPGGRINVDEIVEIPDSASGVEERIPDPGLLIHGAYPNPFNPATQVRFRLPRDASVTLRILDLRGREIWSSSPQSFAPGENTISWRGRTHEGVPAPAGTYLYALRVDGKPAGSGKIMMVK